MYTHIAKPNPSSCAKLAHTPHNALMSQHYWNDALIFHRRALAGDNTSSCYNPNSPLCAQCSDFEMLLGTCTALAQSSADASLGFATGWAIYITFFVVTLYLVFTRRTSWFYAFIITFLSIALATVMQRSIGEIRPPGACMKGGFLVLARIWQHVY